MIVAVPVPQRAKNPALCVPSNACQDVSVPQIDLTEGNTSV